MIFNPKTPKSVIRFNKMSETSRDIYLGWTLGAAAVALIILLMATVDLFMGNWSPAAHFWWSSPASLILAVSIFMLWPAAFTLLFHSKFIIDRDDVPSFNSSLIAAKQAVNQIEQGRKLCRKGVVNEHLDEAYQRAQRQLWAMALKARNIEKLKQYSQGSNTDSFGQSLADGTQLLQKRVKEIVDLGNQAANLVLQQQFANMDLLVPQNTDRLLHLAEALSKLGEDHRTALVEYTEYDEEIVDAEILGS